MKTLEEVRCSLAALKEQLQVRYGVTEIGVFGSYARNEQKAGSDLDIYVDYLETPGLLDLIDLENYLSDQLQAKVDLVPRECIRPELKKYILPEIVRI